LDLPLSSAFFKWLIGEEESLGTEDFEKLEPTIFRSLRDILQTEEEKDFESLDVVSFIFFMLYYNYVNVSILSILANHLWNCAKVERIWRLQKTIANNF